ncbi:ABC transporter permease [archaeon]|jgi:putative ABC transport system permease protein|nr:ABC transporter permease [archaeon]MBT4647292.1 ABC transporter permease [archaeon]MBT6821145.1 ABC transporter permease [archaeon]MBT7391687.1 ABC transporter permease [archaeon]
MKLRKSLKFAINMVLHSKLRSWLTILGIVIGVASVIAIISLGEGMKQSLNSQLGGLGGDLVTVSPGFSSSSKFTHGRGPGGGGGSSSVATEEEVVLDRGDLQALKGISDIELMDTQVRGSVDVSYLGKKGSVTLTGVDQKYWAQITISEIDEGRMLGPADQNVIVIGGKLAEGYFDQPIGINKMVTIEDMAFRVVGILDDSSTSIIMPIMMAYQVIDDKETGIYDSIIIKIKDEENLDLVVEKIENKLKMIRHVTEKTKDFSVSSNKQTQEMIAEFMSSMTMFLTAIAGVSLLVGAVGIANTMFTSVLEKTKEIGIMKAIGAKNKDIMTIFLFNAGLIGLVGGVIGVIFGIILSSLMPIMMSGMGRLGSETVVSINSIILSLSVSIIIGMIAGVIPAYQGSKLKPVDALRYE